MAEPMLVEFLSDADAPCPGCGYNLRGLTSARCPECNEALELKVTLAEPGLAGFLSALVPAACALGFSAILFLWGSVAGAPRGDLSRIGLAALVMGAVTGALIGGRRRFSRLGAGARAGVIAACWALAAFSGLLIILTVA